LKIKGLSAGKTFAIKHLIKCKHFFEGVKERKFVVYSSGDIEKWLKYSDLIRQQKETSKKENRTIT